MLNTKQVRAIANPIAGFGAQYTERTVSDKASSRRSIVYRFFSAQHADALYTALKQSGIKNPIKRTARNGDYASRCTGGEYVRIIADIA
jgi:hypothetical protein